MSGSATTGDLAAWDAVPEGFRFPAFEVVVDQARQTHYHACCDVDTAAFEGYADVSILGQDGAIAVLQAGLPNDGRVHTRHHIRQQGPVLLGEALIVQGRVAPYGASPKGRILKCVFDFLRHDRSLAVTIEAEYLLPHGRDAGPKPAGGPSPAAASATPSAAMEGRSVGTMTLTPDKVVGYSHEVGNLIHFDPAFAAARGFRAPLAQGLMQVTAMLGAIARDGPPAELDFDVHFLRPLFWDETATILRRDDNAYLCAKADGRIAGEGTLRHLRRAG